MSSRGSIQCLTTNSRKFIAATGTVAAASTQGFNYQKRELPLPSISPNPQSRSEKKRTEKRGMTRWMELGAVETIYEADHEEEEDEEEDGDDVGEEEEDSFSNPLSSFNLSPETSSPSINLTSTPCSIPSTPDLQIVVDEWSKASGFKSNVVIRVHAHCFYLHREPMSSHCRYLRRRLTKANDVSISPPLNITVQSFTDVARFCYGRALTLTPFNVAAIRVAAEMLEMEYDGCGGGGGSLVRMTEDFFRREVACDMGRVAVVFQCCVRLLPESGEPAAAIAARCVQMMAAEGENGGDEWFAGLMDVPANSFGMIMESVARWSPHDHDQLYRIADRYFAINKEKLSDEEKIVICHVIDCTKLSHHLLLHLVQNSRLPLRFIFKAMLVPRRHPAASFSPLSSSHSSDQNIATLSDLLHQDAATRQASNLAIRIESLERDVAGLRRHLRWSEDKLAEMETGRASSFRFLGSGGHSKPSVASVPLQTAGVGKEKRGRGLGRILLDGFRRMFRVQGVVVDVVRRGGESSGDGNLSKEEGLGEKKAGDGGQVMINKYLDSY